MSLQEQGFRYVLRGAAGLWVHPANMKPGDVDCTDMDDDEFEAAVMATNGEKS